MDPGAPRAPLKLDLFPAKRTLVGIGCSFDPITADMDILAGEAVSLGMRSVEVEPERQSRKRAGLHPGLVPFNPSGMFHFGFR